MKDKAIGIILGAVNILLLVICLVLYLGKDRVAPEIALGEVIYIYEEGLPDRILLEAVTAWDKQDGELTERVVVEKVVTDRAQKKATIVYGVADAAGNVSRTSRTLEMSIPEKPQLPTAGEAGSN